MPGQLALRNVVKSCLDSCAVRAGRGLLVATMLMLLGGCGERVPETEVTIDSAPESGATVLLEGGLTGVTPATFKGLPEGQLNILLKMERFRDTEDEIRVEAGAPQRFVIEMEPLVGYLTIESEPEGAEVLLDDAVIGKTPIKKYAVGIGEHKYRLSYPDYYPYESEVMDVKTDHQYGVNTKVNLKPQEGKLRVASKPTAASIWLNGKKQSLVTPQEYALAPGNYIVDVYTQGYIMNGTRVTLKPNEPVDVMLEMKPGNVPVGMVLVPGGPFIRGASGRAPDEAPEVEMDVPSFYIDKYEVTNAEFKEVFPEHEFPEGRENFPVAGVSWTQATEFAKQVGKRLPTEREWEKAARGTSGLEFPWGNEFDQAVCNTKQSDVGGPVERGKYIEGLSPYGCVDMAGNVYEWTQDWYQAYDGNTEVTKDYGQIFRVLRGGSYKSDRFDVRCAKRHFDKISATREDYGFRCALSVP